LLKTIKFNSPQETAQELGFDLSQELIALKNRGYKVLLLLSGGSALSVLTHISNNGLGEHLTIGMLDERYDPSNQDSNFIQLTKTEFYRRAKKSGCSFIDTSTKRGQTQKEMGNYFEKNLKTWKKINKRGIILATLGMGTDGHIAGIMPFPKNDKRFQWLFMGKNWVAAYDATNKNLYPLRVTTTITFLKIINSGFVYICGENKAAAFKKISSPGKISELPCRALKQSKKITIYTDIK